MLEHLTSIGQLIVGAAIAASLVFVAIQLRETRKQTQANILQHRVDSRIEIWGRQLDTAAFHSALDKFFEHEIYKRDDLLEEIDELTLQERRALNSALLIELHYFQNQFYQRTQNIMDAEQHAPLDYMRCMTQTPHRRIWKDKIRLAGHFPNDYISHVDQIVKLYDQVEKIMDEDEDADFESVVAHVFRTPSPPQWISS